MNEYYLAHSTDESKLRSIIKGGYLLSGYYAKKSRFFGTPTAKYIYLSLFSDKTIPYFKEITLFFKIDILYERTWRYHLGWKSEDNPTSEKINYKHRNVTKHLKKIKKHIIEYKGIGPTKIIGFSHEIMIYKSINLDKYLYAVCCDSMLSKKTMDLIKKYYPNVKILHSYPESVEELEKNI